MTRRVVDAVHSQLLCDEIARQLISSSTNCMRPEAEEKKDLKSESSLSSLAPSELSALV